MKFKIPVCVNVLSPLAFERPDEFLDAVRTFCELIPVITPEKWGWYEPLDRDFDPKNLAQLAPDGKFGVLGEEREGCDTIYWKRKMRPRAEGSFSVRWRSKSPKAHDTHAGISFDTELGQVDQNVLVSYLKKASVRTKADFALLDALSEPYRDFAIESESARYGQHFYVVTHVLRHWLPDVFWGTVFGSAYVRLFGKERLLSAPAYIVEELGAEMVYVQLTGRIADTVEDSQKVQSCRAAFKEHLCCNAFFISGQGYDYRQQGPHGDAFSVPTFNLSG